MKVKKLIFCLIIILSHFIIITAQNTDTASLNGRVIDIVGNSAPGMKVKIRDKKGKIFETVTDADGFYSVKLLPGDYLIEVESGGGLFGVKVENYKIAPTKMTLDIVLEIDIDAPTTHSTVKRKTEKKDRESIRFLKQQ